MEELEGVIQQNQALSCQETAMRISLHLFHAIYSKHDQFHNKNHYRKRENQESEKL